MLFDLASKQFKNFRLHGVDADFPVGLLLPSVGRALADTQKHRPFETCPAHAITKFSHGISCPRLSHNSPRSIFPASSPYPTFFNASTMRRRSFKAPSRQSDETDLICGGARGVFGGV